MYTALYIYIRTIRIRCSGFVYVHMCASKFSHTFFSSILFCSLHTHIHTRMYIYGRRGSIINLIKGASARAYGEPRRSIARESVPFF